MTDRKKLAGAVRAKRGARSLRDVEPEAGVSRAALSRIENEEGIDLDTFGTVCKWLGVPWDFFKADELVEA